MNLFWPLLFAAASVSHGIAYLIHGKPDSLFFMGFMALFAVLMLLFEIRDRSRS